MYQFGPNDSVPPKCPLCGHLAMQHTRTPNGKRCIGNQWRCKCDQRPLSMVITRSMIDAFPKPQVDR
jgi:hypothetical protein